MPLGASGWTVTRESSHLGRRLLERGNEEGTYKTGAMRTKCGLEVGRLVKAMLESGLQCETVRPHEVFLHLGLAYHPISVTYGKKTGT